MKYLPQNTIVLSSYMQKSYIFYFIYIFVTLYQQNLQTKMVILVNFGLKTTQQKHFVYMLTLHLPRWRCSMHGQSSPKHTSYRSNTYCDSLVGVYNLEASVDIMDKNILGTVLCSMTIWEVLYLYWNMANGSSLFGEIHQTGPMELVEVVIPHTKEAN